MPDFTFIKNIASNTYLRVLAAVAAITILSVFILGSTSTNKLVPAEPTPGTVEDVVPAVNMSKSNETTGSEEVTAELKPSDETTTSP
jgi:hypothetical protein